MFRTIFNLEEKKIGLADVDYWRTVQGQRIGFIGNPGDGIPIAGSEWAKAALVGNSEEESETEPKGGWNYRSSSGVSFTKKRFEAIAESIAEVMPYTSDSALLFQDGDDLFEIDDASFEKTPERRPTLSGLKISVFVDHKDRGGGAAAKMKFGDGGMTVDGFVKVDVNSEESSSFKPDILAKARQFQVFSDAVSVYAEHHVPAVRDPKKAKSNEAQYRDAHEILKRACRAPLGPKAKQFIEDQGGLVRGMSLPPEDLVQLLQAYNEGSGAILNLGQMSSFTLGTNRSVARSFAGSGSGRSVLIELKNPKRGTNIAPMSYFRSEMEFLTAGRLRVTGVKDDKGMTVLEVEQID